MSFVFKHCLPVLEELIQLLKQLCLKHPTTQTRLNSTLITPKGSYKSRTKRFTSYAQPIVFLINLAVNANRSDILEKHHTLHKNVSSPLLRNIRSITNDNLPNLLTALNT